MSRGFLADSELPAKARSGQHKLTRPCIACNQGCLDKVFMIEHVTCTLNPLAGYEIERELSSPGEGRIAVIGGGPAGMETARVLTLRGFDVTIYEKSERLGGLLHLAAKIPGRGEFAAYVSYMERELKHLGVSVRLNESASVDSLVDESYDCIVVATGTVAGAPAIDGVEMSHVTTAYDVISLGLDDLGDVIIIGGSALGCYTALYLASRANSIHIFESDEALGVDLGRTTRWVIMKGLKEKGIHMHTNAKATEIDSRHTFVIIDGVYEKVKAKTVVLATKPQPQDRILKRLKQTSLRIESVGSIRGSIDLLEVIHEAYKFANSFQL